MNPVCPACGSKNLRPCHSHGTWDRLKSLLGFGDVRCRDCGNKFGEAVLWVPGIPFARCPRCFRDDLTDWSEKYFHPPAWSRMLLYVGGRQHRCAVCRVNFVSFLPRKRQFNPSWKQKPAKTVDSSTDVSDTVNSEV